MTRRSFLARVSGGALAGGALGVVTGCSTDAGNNLAAANRPAGGLTDCDRGPEADETGQGRSGNRTGYSDTDSEANADAAGCGRPRAGAPITDSDRGRLADPAGRGRGAAGRYSDNDMGWSADPVGRGSRGAAPGNGQ